MKSPLSGARAPIASLVLAFCVSAAHAHVDWTQVNQVDPGLFGLYHFDDSTAAVGDVLDVPFGINASRGLTVAALTPPGAGMSVSTELVEPFFGPGSLRLDGAQRADSAFVIPSGAAGDTTIEFWLKWDAAPSASEIQVGLRSSAKVRIVRDTANPANDRFGILATHGDYTSAPGFVDWPTVGTEEAPLDEWIHVAMTVHSTGFTYDSLAGHDRWNAGSTARLYLNGHAVGSAPHTVSVESMQVHDDSKLTVNNISGAVTIDEVAVWSSDLSNDGAVATPFADGRGSGVSAVADWAAFR